jgi:YHS domain-containing protein
MYYFCWKKAELMKISFQLKEHKYVQREIL